MSWLGRYRSPILFGLIGLFVVGVGVLALRWPRPTGVEIVLPAATATSAVIQTPAPLRVYVCGAVRYPDVYRLPPDSIVEDALEAAGGPTEQADLIRINLAQALSDQTQVYVPSLQEAVPMAPVSTPAVLRGPIPQAEAGIDLNSATLEELDTLPGIGPALGQRIIEHRPYKDIEDLLEVPGIGPATFEKLRDRIMVR